MRAGTKLGKYRIRKSIAKGGMGEVYLATDEDLDRDAAVKILLAEFCCDLERVNRFKMEARAASALNHPNIITIYEIGEHEGLIYIATENINGETLREKIEKGELRHIEAIKIAEQVADALAVAHEAGIVHRDIKPENIMVRHDGIVKILDFGLAKPIFQQKVGTEDETIQMVQTQPGIVMGSVRYMSPEQARGKDTDERSDVWSLGVVLYEMLTGRNPFEGETISDSLAALIHVEPAPLEDIPEELQRILRKSLKKKAEERYQSIKDFALDLKDLHAEAIDYSTENSLNNLAKTVGFKRYPTNENETLIHHTTSAENEFTAHGSKYLSKRRTDTAAAHNVRRLLPAGIIAIAVILALGGWFLLPKLLGNNAVDFQSIQASLLTQTGNAYLAEISPDGRFVAFVNRHEGRQSLVVKQIGTGTLLTVVPPSLSGFFQPSFTPDGELIYYVQYDKGFGTLYRVSTLGGEIKKIITDIDTKVTFSTDGGRFAFIRHNPTEGGDTIFIADKDGTKAEAFLQTKEIGYDRFAGADWSPDGSKILVSASKSGSELSQQQQLITVDLKDKRISLLGGKNWIELKSFKWLNDGTGIVLVGKNNTGETAQIWHFAYPGGEVRQITTDTGDYESVSVSADGNSLVTTRADTISSFWSYNPQSREMRQLTSENKTLLGFAGISQTPDGKFLFAKNTGKEINIFTMDESGAGEKQLTANAGINLNPAVSPDGKYVVFSSNRNSGALALWRMNADGSGAVQITFPENSADLQAQISADGKSVYFTRQTVDGGKAKIMKVPVEGGDTVALTAADNQSELQPRLSFDGKKLAFNTFNYDGNTSNFEMGLKVVGMNNEKIDNTARSLELKIGSKFVWSPDGKSLTYLNKAGIDNLWSISLEDKKEKPLTEFTSGNISNFLWSKDGKKLYIVRAIFNSDLVLIKDSTKT